MATCPQCGESFEDAQYCPIDGASLDESVNRIGQVVGERYRVRAKLGEGGVGEIFEAEHLYLDKRVALKLLRPAFAADPEAVRRLEREARSASAIGHPNIVRVEDFGRSEAQAYLAMELVEGESLEAYIKRGDGDAHLALELVAQVCEGLAAAHAAGVVHRDLKPANIVLSRGEQGELVAKVLDFGIAKLVTSDANLTRTGTLVGTPYYMAPEQALGAEVDHRADVYAVGVILYQLMTGAVPFSADSFIAILHKHTSEEPAAPSTRVAGGLPEAVDRLILRCMAKKPADRYQDMQSLRDELRALAGGDLDALPLARSKSPELGRGDGDRSEGSQSGVSIGAEVTDRLAQSDKPPSREPRRRAGLSVAVVALAVVALFAGALALRSGGMDAGASALDAGAGVSLDAAAPGAADAETPDAAPQPAERDAWTFEGEDGAMRYAAAVIPALPQARQRLDIELDIEPIEPELMAAIAAGQAEVRFAFKFYQDHRTVAEIARDLGEDRLVRAILSPPDPGKYHVDVWIQGDGREYARFYFDICVGADARDPEAREALCPDMHLP